MIDAPPLILAAGPEAVSAWDDFTSDLGFRASTRSNYRGAALRFLHWLEPQGIELAEVTPHLVERFLDEMYQSVGSKTTCRSALRRFFEALVARKAVPSNPAYQARRGSDDALLVPPSLAELRDAIRELDPAAMDDAPDMLDAGVVLLAGLHLGTKNLKRISRFTGVALEQVTEFAERLRANGVWLADGRTAGMWDQENGEIALLIDILVAVGMVECRPADADPPASAKAAPAETA